MINWTWFIVAVVAVYALGAVWFSLIFPKMWAKIFKVEIPSKPGKGNMILTMLMQLVATGLYGLLLFVLAGMSVWVAVAAVVVFCAWQKATLKFRHFSWGEFSWAALIEAGYTFLSGVVFILFASI